MSAPPNWPGNRLLLALPSSNLKQLMPELEHIHCGREQVLMDADSPLDHVFFPDSGVVSVVAVYADGSVIEMATIGREGCTAVQAVFGAKRSSVRLLVQIPGSAAKMSRAAFTRAMGSMPSFRSLMYAYVQAFLEQVLVSVACNGAHSLKQRLARWLLMMRDRGDDDALQINQVRKRGREGDFQLRGERRAAGKAVAIQRRCERMPEWHAAISRHALDAEFGCLLIRRHDDPKPDMNIWRGLTALGLLSAGQRGCETMLLDLAGNHPINAARACRTRSERLTCSKQRTAARAN